MPTRPLPDRVAGPLGCCILLHSVPRSYLCRSSVPSRRSSPQPNHFMYKLLPTSLLALLGWSAKFAALIAPLAGATLASAQVPQFPDLVEALSPQAPVAASPVLDGATVVRQRQIVLQRELLESNWNSLRITPFPGVTALARVVKLDRERDDAFIWIAQVEGDQAGSAVFSLYDDTLLGELRTSDRVFLFHANAAGAGTVSEVLAPTLS
ncbi:MAG: hypothetical protein RL112_1987, partial [Planctomycetota bacterium]